MGDYSIIISIHILYMNLLKAQIFQLRLTQVYIYKTCNTTTLNIRG